VWYVILIGTFLTEGTLRVKTIEIAAAAITTPSAFKMIDSSPFQFA